MNIIKEFIRFTNVDKEGKQLLLLLCIASFLYCAMESVLMNIVYQIGNTMVYFVALYVIVLSSGYGFMMILFQFLQSKRGIKKKVVMKPYIVPYVKVQCILSSILILGSYGLYAIQIHWLYSIMNAILFLCIIMYFPIQILSMFSIYDGHRNSIRIIYQAFYSMIKHYRSIFYSYICLLLLGYGCSCIIMNLSGIGYIMNASILAIDFLLRSNSFMLFFELFNTIFDSSTLMIASGIAFVYGVIMHVFLVFYFMLMSCIYDEDIHV